MNRSDFVNTALWQKQDLSYREFYAKLIPTVPKELIIGVHMPQLRKIAKVMQDNGKWREFLDTLPHTYYEENNIHALLIGEIKDFDLCIAEIDRFLPFVDNWATCDSLRPKCFRENSGKLLLKIKEWLLTRETYTVRFAVEMLMLWFLDENFKPEYLALTGSVQSDEYYVNMMQAWYFATALAKQYDATLQYLNAQKLSCWVHNKAIQKAIESNCLTPGQKTHLRTLKRKE